MDKCVYYMWITIYIMWITLVTTNKGQCQVKVKNNWMRMTNAHNYHIIPPYFDLLYLEYFGI